MYASKQINYLIILNCLVVRVYGFIVCKNHVNLQH